MKKLAIFVIFIFAIGISCQAQQTAKDIITKTFKLYRQVLSEREETTATIIYEDDRKEDKEDGRKEYKVFTRWILFDPAGEDKVIIKFSEPALNNGLGLLIYRHSDSKDEQWLKLPSFNRTRKIAIANQSQYFGGTDITFEDAHQLIEERTQDFEYNEILSPDDGWKIEAVPNSGVDSGYSKRIFFIRPDFACTAVEYYNNSDEPFKTQENSEIEIYENGMWRAKKVVITNRSLKRTTELTVTEREFENVNTNVFTQDFLLRKE